mgnify:CR=1 FL=1
MSFIDLLGRSIYKGKHWAEEIGYACVDLSGPVLQGLLV